LSQILKKSIGSLYIHGKEPGTDMITEEAYARPTFVVNLDNKLTYETKGHGNYEMISCRDRLLTMR
jgi:hypothetical protein